MAGSLSGCEEQIEFGERTPADKGERSADALGEPFQRDGQIGRNHHLERGRREVENGPVHVKQNGPGRQGNGVDKQFALQIATFSIEYRWRTNAGEPRPRN